MSKSWHEKLHVKAEPKVERLEKPFAGLPIGSRLFIATPLLIKNYIDRIPRGESISIPRMREDLAREYDADATCPLTTGIFVRIVAEAAWDELRTGKAPSDVTPFWRVVDAKAPVAKKLTFGTDFLIAQRVSEGLEAPISGKARPATARKRR